MLAAAVMGMSACAGTKGAQVTDSGAGETSLKTYDWSEASLYEAEDGTMLGAAKTESAVAGFSGNGYVSGLASDGDGVSLKIAVEEDGHYDLAFSTCSADGGHKDNYVWVDGENVGTISSEGTVFADSVIGRVYLTAGEHTVEVKKYWGWALIDSVKIKHSDDIDPAIYSVSAELVNPNATDNTKRLFHYLCDIYGKQILSGQYCDTGMIGSENMAIWKTTGGEYPAVLGLDFIEYTPSRVANGSVGHATELAINYWENGGIVTFCWHWNAPEKYLTGQWYSGFNTAYTNIDLAKIMNGEDPEGYDLLMEDIDAIAAQISILQEAGAPILWRPLHEASGGWFWWGASGPEAYKQLYVLLYEKLTNEYGLNNLIWVWNGQDPDWYPGDEYVDIVGEDLYPGEHVYTPQTNKFFEAVDYTEGRKMVVMSENGCLFDPDQALRDGAMWGFFCTWSGEFVVKNTSIVALSEQYTEESMIQKVYASDLVITRSELPDLKNYPIEE